MRLLTCCFLATALCAKLLAADLSLAPPSFSLSGKKIIPINFKEVWLDISFDTQARTATGVATVHFLAEENGYPMMDLIPEATEVTLNGASSRLITISDPANVTKFRMLDSEVAAGSSNVLRIVYPLNSSTYTLNSSGARFGFFMGDVSAPQQRGFMEKYAPTNFEFDAYRMSVDLHVVPNPGKHQLFTNGVIDSATDGHWRVHFPPHFITSSFYLHLSNQEFVVRQSTYKGLNRDIPVTSYASSSTLADSGLQRALNVLKENEAAYGAYAHPAALAYVTPDGGGMEYCGATMTSLGALGHEFTHFWFARGVMPANGNAGWIDEAIASWRDNGYPTNSSPGSPALLGGFTDFRRMTPNAAYVEGARLMSYFDNQFNGGLKPVLRQLFAEKQLDRITSPWLQAFLERVTGQNLEQTFRKYVYQKSSVHLWDLYPAQVKIPEQYTHRHPRPYTQTEIEKYR